MTPWNWHEAVKEIFLPRTEEVDNEKPKTNWRFEYVQIVQLDKTNATGVANNTNQLVIIG